MYFHQVLDVLANAHLGLRGFHPVAPKMGAAGGSLAQESPIFVSKSRGNNQESPKLPVVGSLCLQRFLAKWEVYRSEEIYRVWGWFGRWLGESLF